MIHIRISDIINVIVVSEFKNFHKASEYLHISQPALSQSIQRLESDLGCLLFTRSKKTVKLTEEGQQFVTEGAKIVKIYDNLISNICKKEAHSNSIRLCASQVYAKYYFPEIFKRFRDNHPDTNLQMYEAQNAERLKALHNREVDLAVIKDMESSDVKRVMLFKEHLVLVAPKELMEQKKDYIYSVNGLEYVNIKGFSDVPFLSYSKNNTMNFATNEICLEAGFIPNVIFETADPELLMKLVACGMGVGLLASLTQIVSKHDDSLSYYFVESPHAHRTYVLAWDSTIIPTKEMRDLINIIQSIHVEHHHSEEWSHEK